MHTQTHILTELVETELRLKLKMVAFQSSIIILGTAGKENITLK